MSSKIKTFDIILPIIPLLIIASSIAVIYSLVLNTVDAELVFKQGLSAIIGLALMISISFVDYRFFRGISWMLYAAGITLIFLAWLLAERCAG
jgi:cell division protein FtsW (lipid II flippase)